MLGRDNLPYRYVIQQIKKKQTAILRKMTVRLKKELRLLVIVRHF